MLDVPSTVLRRMKWVDISQCWRSRTIGFRLHGNARDLSRSTLFELAKYEVVFFES